MLDQYRKTATLFMVCQDYHSGQWSRGYRLQCALLRRLYRAGYTHRYDLRRIISDTMYNQMVAACADKL
jgi:hypothetical protein